jgi:hypothetical protein
MPCPGQVSRTPYFSAFMQPTDHEHQEFQAKPRVSPKLGTRELATLDIVSPYLATLCEQLINTDLHLAV